MTNMFCKKNSLKLWLRILLCMVLLIAFAGCGSGDAGDDTAASNETAAAEETTAEESNQGKLDTKSLAGALGSIQAEEPSVTQHIMYADQDDGYANVRKGPGTNYDVVGMVKNGNIVTVTGPVDGWYQITSGSFTGYYIHKSTLSDDWSRQEVSKRMFVSSSDGEANVRMGRSSNSQVWGKLYNGTAVYVSHLKDGWYLIDYGIFSGYYIHESMLSELQPDMAVTEVRYVSEPDGYANVRNGRGTNYDVVGRLDNGSVVQVTNLHDGWYEIASDPYRGYYISQSTLAQ